MDVICDCMTTELVVPKELVAGEGEYSLTLLGGSGGEYSRALRGENGGFV